MKVSGSYGHDAAVDKGLKSAGESLKVTDKAGKKGGDWSQGNDLAEGVSALSKCGDCGDMYGAHEGTQRMPKHSDRV